MRILLSWIGNSDLTAAEQDDPANLGPIAQALNADEYSTAIFLDNYHNPRVNVFIKWIKQRFNGDIKIYHVKLTTPTDHKDIYSSVRDILNNIDNNYKFYEKVFHLSPGTPAMALVWMLLAPRYGAKLIESSRESGVKLVSIPFEISAYFLPDKELEILTRADSPIHPAFKDILHYSQIMKNAVRQAIYMAPRDITVLIEGESGTGKELFARAIHNASTRFQSPFIPVNCGALPSELVESLLFGHKKGAFTGATKDSPGYFGEAEEGTLFLDELGELPRSAQVKLLRALEEHAIVRVGESQERKINVRIIAATNRNLLHEVANGNFRSDLFYRIAVGIIRLPALRDRGEDLEMLLEQALAEANQKLSSQGKPTHKIFSDSAKNIMLNHAWPGNVRELKNTVMRAVLWGNGDVIDADTAKQSLLVLDTQNDTEMDHHLGDGFKLEEVLATVEKHYIKKALAESHGRIVTAAKLLGFNNYQTFNNRLKKYGIS